MAFLEVKILLPNAVAHQTFAETDAGENIVRCENAEDMIARLGI
jgi:hypothetical protein